jgi:ComF family protein
MQCGVCIVSPPSFDVARSVMAYNAVAAKQIAALKFHDRSSMLQHFARALQQSGAELLAQANLIVPVPLHTRRLLKRRYNQAAWLGFALSDITAVPCVPGALRRTRYTGTQTGKRRKIRLQNLHGAFAVPPDYVTPMKGARVVLIDDVMTTGATANACAKALKKAGASWVGVLTLAHTVLEP